MMIAVSGALAISASARARPLRSLFWALANSGQEEHEGRKGVKDDVARGFDPLSEVVIGCAIDVHRELGPGLLETTYRSCLTQELELHGVAFETEAPVSIEYKATRVPCAYRI